MKKFIRQAAALLLCAALLLAGAASAAAQTDPVEERLSAMSLREKVGQLFVVRIEALDTGWGASSTELTIIKIDSASSRPFFTPIGGFFFPL